MDRILIEDLRLRCIVGINPEERIKEQDITLQIALDVDLRAAGQSDDMNDTVDYKTLKEAVRDMVEASSFLLIERLATEVARVCLRPLRVQRARIKVEKPGALRFARTVAVEIERRREELYPEG